jgi:O-antigen ligase
MSTDVKVARRGGWGDMVEQERSAPALLWDAGWASVLLMISSAAELLRTQSSKISAGVLFLLVAGTAAFTRSFSKLSIGPVYITELCMAILAITLGSLVIRKKIILFPATRMARRIFYLIMGYLCFGTLRLVPDVISGGSGNLIATIRNFAIVYYASFALIGWLVLQRHKAHTMVRSILWTIVILSTVTSLWPAMAYFMGVPAVADESTIDVSVVIQGHAVVFAMFSLLVVINLLRYGAVPKHPLARGLVLVLFLLNLVYIYLSGHRSALVGCIAGVAALVLASKKMMHARIRWRWVILALAIASCTFYFLAGHLAEFALKFETLSSPLEEANAAWRAGFWLNVAFLWLSRPFVGVGFAHDFFNEEPLHLAFVEHDDPHNSYLAILARSGVVGLFFIMASSLLFVILMVKLLRRSSSRQTLLLAGCLLTCFVAIGTFAAANVTLESPYHAIFFWLFIGMGVCLAERDQPRRAGCD